MVVLISCVSLSFISKTKRGDHNKVQKLWSGPMKYNFNRTWDVAPMLWNKPKYNYNTIIFSFLTAACCLLSGLNSADHSAKYKLNTCLFWDYSERKEMFFRGSRRTHYCKIGTTSAIEKEGQKIKWHFECFSSFSNSQVFSLHKNLNWYFDSILFCLHF